MHRNTRTRYENKSSHSPCFFKHLPPDVTPRYGRDTLWTWLGHRFDTKYVIRYDTLSASWYHKPPGHKLSSVSKISPLRHTQGCTMSHQQLMIFYLVTTKEYFNGMVLPLQLVILLLQHFPLVIHISGNFHWNVEDVAKSIICMIMSGPCLTGYAQVTSLYDVFGSCFYN